MQTAVTRIGRAHRHGQRKVLSRAALMTGAALGAVVFAGTAVLPERALAANECGPISVGTPDTVACLGNIAYPSGIHYTDASANDLSVILFGQVGPIPPVAIVSSGDGLDARQTGGHNLYVQTFAGTSIAAAGAFGIHAYTTFGGNVSVVNAAPISGATVTGIKATNAGSGASATVVNSGAITMAGGSLDGIQVESYFGAGGPVTIVNSGAISGAAYGEFLGTVGSAAVSVNSGAITASGSSSAWGIRIGGPSGGWGASTATIVNGAAISATASAGNAYGLAAAATGDVTVVNSGAITVNGTTTGADIWGYSTSGGNVTVVNSGLLGSTWDGIRASGGGAGNITVVMPTGAIIADHDGINAATAGTGPVTVVLGNATTGVDILATSHDGVYTAGNGSISIIDHGNVTAGVVGIVAKGQGGGAGIVDVRTYGLVDAHGINGILATTSESGGLNILEAGGVSGHAATYGIHALDSGSTGNVSVVVTGQVGVSYGASLVGVDAQQTGGGNGTVTVTGTAKVYGGSNGIFAFSNGSGAVTIDFSGPVSASYALTGWGGGTGAVHVTNHSVINAGMVGVTAFSTGPGAAYAVNDGTIFMSNGARAGVEGESSISGTGAVTVINNGWIDPAGNGTMGIILNPASSAPLTVTNTGYSLGVFNGIAAYNAGHGTIVVNNSGVTRAENYYGVYAVAKQGGNVTVNNTGGVIRGGSHYLYGFGLGAGVFSNTSGTTTINNSGLIHSDSGRAVWTFSLGGPTTINNNGDITGFVSLSGNSTINNTGFWDVYGTSTFHTGNGTINVINNSQQVVVGLGSPGPVVINGLTTFNNSGIVDMRNHHVGDVLVLGTNGSAAWNASGGSTLAVEADLTAPLVADELVIGTTTGATTVVLRDSAPNAPAALNFSGVTVVSTLGGSGTFNMARYHKGFVDYELIDPPAPVTWKLYGLPANDAFEMLKLPAMGQDFWRRTGDVWSAREQEVRDSGRQPGWEMWAQAFGGAQNDTRPSQHFTVGGFGFNPNLGTDEDYRGFQMGGDQLSANHWLWGFTGGYMDQNGRFRALDPVTGTGGGVVHNDVDLTGWNVGVYGGWNSGGFFLNGLIKGDWFSADINMQSAGVRRDVDGDSWGAKGEMGFRWGGPSFYLEPIADVDWISTHIDSVTMAGATFNWSDATSSKGELGARIGGTWGSIIPYVGAYWVDQWSGDNKMTMLTGAGCPSCMSIEDTRPGSYGKSDFGFTITNWSGLEGFLKGEALFGSNVEGYAARLGVRWHW
jgi:hypothetical protein